MTQKKEKVDEEIMAIIKWCMEIENLFVAAGASLTDAQNQIEDHIEWFTDLYYDGLTPEQAAKEAMNDPE